MKHEAFYDICISKILVLLDLKSVFKLAVKMLKVFKRKICKVCVLSRLQSKILSVSKPLNYEKPWNTAISLGLPSLFNLATVVWWSVSDSGAPSGFQDGRWNGEDILKIMVIKHCLECTLTLTPDNMSINKKQYGNFSSSQVMRLSSK